MGGAVGDIVGPGDGASVGAGVGSGMTGAIVWPIAAGCGVVYSVGLGVRTGARVSPGPCEGMGRR